MNRDSNSAMFSFQDPAGIFELIEVVGNGTYGQVYKVSVTGNVEFVINFPFRKLELCTDSDYKAAYDDAAVHRHKI